MHPSVAVINTKLQNEYCFGVCVFCCSSFVFFGFFVVGRVCWFFCVLVFHVISWLGVIFIFCCLGILVFAFPFFVLCVGFLSLLFFFVDCCCVLSLLVGIFSVFFCFFFGRFVVFVVYFSFSLVMEFISLPCGVSKFCTALCFVLFSLVVISFGGLVLEQSCMFASCLWVIRLWRTGTINFFFLESSPLFMLGVF